MVLKIITRMIQDLLPGIYAQQLAPREGVIVNIGRAKESATMSDEFMPVYAVDVLRQHALPAVRKLAEQHRYTHTCKTLAQG